MWSGVAVQRIEKDFWPGRIQPPWSVALWHESAPGTMKSPVHSALSQCPVLQAPYYSLVPLAPLIIHYAVFGFHFPVASMVSFTPLIRWPDFLGRNLIIPSCSGMSALVPHLLELDLVSMPSLVSLGVVWAEASSMWSPLCTYLWCVMAMHTAKVSLLATAAMSYV